jgi:hypothetical protein
MANNTDKRTASQRIDDLEKAVMSIFNVANNMARENTLIKNAIKLLDNKVDSIVQAATAGKPITNEVLDAIMKENEIEELKGKVDNLIKQGFLVPTDGAAVDSFVVGAETEPDAEDGTPGKVRHARLQFTVQSLAKEIQEKLAGAKPGDTVKFKDDAYVFKVAEVYKIVNPTPPAAAAPATEAPAETSGVVMDSAPATEAAPAAPQSSTDATTAEPAATDTTQAAGN